MAISPVEPLPDVYQLEGNSVLYWLAKLAVKGQILPTQTEDIFLSQLAWAGWVGLFVTGLNLIPGGSERGTVGHVAYTLFGRRARRLFVPVIIGLIALVIITQTLMWVFWIFILFFLGRIYAEPLEDVTPLDGRRKWLAVFTLLLFLLVFVPIPLSIVSS